MIRIRIRSVDTPNHKVPGVYENCLKKASAARSPEGELIRNLRAVEVLEHIGTPEARQVLQTLAGGAEGARLTVAAREALRRGQRNGTAP